LVTSNLFYGIKVVYYIIAIIQVVRRFKMKSLKIASTAVVIFIIVMFSISARAQDTTTTKSTNTEQNQVQQENQNQIQHGQQFIDEDGDGYNDNAPDHDGDGIPNGLDPDYQALQKRLRARQNMEFVDLDGDGINDNLFKSGEGQQRHQIGPQQGTDKPTDSPQAGSREQQRKGKGKNK